MLRRSTLGFALAFTVILISAASGRTTWYVDDDGNPGNGCTSWIDACPELQTALSLATSGDQIWVAAGVYKPDYDVTTGQHTGDRNATFHLINGVAVYGGFDGTEISLEDRAGLFDQTILSGDLNGDDDPAEFPDGPSFAENSYHVVTGSDIDETALLDGFTIAGGSANGSNTDTLGGGMYNSEGSPTVTNCTFSGNSAVTGGGMANWWSSRPVLTNCTFSGNSATTNDGGGMANSNSDPTVTNCTFSNNTAAGGGGGMENSNGNPTVTNCTFSGNSATDGGGMSNDESSPTVTNCTFSANSAPNGRAVACREGESNVVITNCILRNGGDEVSGDRPFCTITITYSDIQGGWPGEGNIDADPLFVDVANENLRLLPGSPCVDAANNAAVPADTADLDGDGDTTEPTPFDLDGNPRFVNDPTSEDCWQAPGTCGDPPVIDMGAYEHVNADLDGDGDVDAADLALLLGSWGSYEPCPPHIPADLDQDCDVDATDLAMLLGNWG